MKPARTTSTGPVAVNPRRLLAIRRLVASGIGILALLAISDLFIAGQGNKLALFRLALFLAMFGLWWWTRRVHTSAALAATVYTQLLLISISSSLSLFFDQSRLTASLDTMMLVIVVSGSGWPTLRYFIGGTLVCLVPMAVGLIMARAPAAVASHHAIYLGASVLVAYAMWRQRLFAAKASADLRAELERRASLDMMTDTLNRGGWNTKAPLKLEAADAANLPVSLLYLDLDHFKSINDRHGHAVGDAVIEHAARLIRSEVREIDLVARLGGEEFAVLLTGPGAIGAPAVAERIRSNFETNHGPVPCNVCVGVADRLPGETLGALMIRADAALLRAKRSGRNRVESTRVPA